MEEILDNQSTQDENTNQIENINPPENNEETLANNTKKTKSKFFINSGLYSFLMIFGVVFLVSLYFFQVFMSPIKVVGKSMQPTINSMVVSDDDQDHCDIVYYRKKRSYTNDDIVIISNENDKYVDSEDPENPAKYLIKRVIACPGDEITFFVTNYEDNVYHYDISVKNKNGEQVSLTDTYLNEEMKFTESEYRANKFYYNTELKNKSYYQTYIEIFSVLVESTEINYTSYTLKISDNEYFVMGDNRNHSRDSRYFGTVSTEYISGKVILQVPYGQNIWQALWTKLKEQL